MNPVAPVDVVLDDSALLALGSGNVLASRLLYQAAETGAWRIHVALATLAEADRVRTGLAGHLGMLDQVVFHPLDLAAVLAASGHERPLGWCHTHHVAMPSPERLDGARVATVQPKDWYGVGVRVLDLSP
ncbi:PIN domain-containing protein [Streptomyces sp. S6]